MRSNMAHQSIHPLVAPKAVLRRPRDSHPSCWCIGGVGVESARRRSRAGPRSAEPLKGSPLLPAAERLFENRGNAVGIVGNHSRGISKVRPDRSARRRLQLIGVVAVNVVGVLQDVTRQHRYHILARGRCPPPPLLQPGEGRGGSRLAADSATPDNGLGVGDLLLRDSLDGASGVLNLKHCLGPGNRIANPNGGGQRLRIP
jgi:hypothetical protein